MSFSVTPDMIQSITVNSRCLKTKPCRHHCNIILSDERQIEVSLRALEVFAIIDSIPQDKIKGEGFSHYREEEEKPAIASEVLSGIFKVENPSIYAKIQGKIFKK